MKLVIGDKNSSSWSMRPWLVLRHFDIPFEEVLIRLGQPDTKETIRRYSPSCKVPCLITDSGEAVWESLAIIETLAECFPQLAMWPRAQKKSRWLSVCSTCLQSTKLFNRAKGNRAMPLLRKKEFRRFSRKLEELDKCRKTRSRFFLVE